MNGADAVVLSIAGTEQGAAHLSLELLNSGRREPGRRPAGRGAVLVSHRVPPSGACVATGWAACLTRAPVLPRGSTECSGTVMISYSSRGLHDRFVQYISHRISHAHYHPVAFAHVLPLWAQTTNSSCQRARPHPLFIGLETIPHTRLGHQIAWASRIRLQFVSELPHIDSHVVRGAGLVRSPHLLQQLPLGHHAAGVPHQHGEELVLNGSEMNLLIGHIDASMPQVDSELPHCEHRLPRLLCQVRGMAQGDAHARQQFLDAKGLSQVVICASVEGHYLVGFLTACGEDENRYGHPLTQPTCHL